MVDKKLWAKDQEIDFFTKSLEVDFFTKSLEVASPEQLFYTTKDKKYMPIGLKAIKVQKQHYKAEMLLLVHIQKNGRKKF